MKGVEIEAHDDILSHGVEELEIKHIDDIPARIDAAVAYVMDGVEGAMADQALAVAEAQGEIDARIQAARDELEGALAEKELQLAADMDAATEALQEGLRSRQADAEDAVDADRQAATENVQNNKAEILANIKDLIWSLGYGTFESFDGYYDYSLNQNYADHTYGGLAGEYA